jgi:hypothetical protein
VSDFVEECRGEWKRLGVPDVVANEMAADVAADLAEAEAEGASPEYVLGSEAFDPRSFAAAWAYARGVAERPSPDGHQPRRWLVIAAVTAFALVAIAGGVLAVVDSSSTSERREALPSGTIWVSGPSPDGSPVVVRASAPLLDDLPRVVSLPLPPELQVRETDEVADNSGLDTRTLGYVLLAIGLAGAVAVWLGQAISAAGRSARRRTTTA